MSSGFQGDGEYGGAPAPSAAATSFDLDKPKAFAGKREVVIGGFKVAFITEQKGSNTTRGSFLGGGGKGRASATALLRGVPQETMQAITDAAYEDFKAQLAANGYTVRPFDFIRQNAAFQAVAAKSSPYKTNEPMPAMSASALIFAPQGQKLRLFAAQGAGSQGLGWSSPESGFSKVAVETGVPVIDVHYVVGFAHFGGHSSRTTTSISVDQGISVIKGSQVFITSGYGGTFSTDIGSIRLADPVASAQQFAAIGEQEKSGMDKVGSMIATGAAVLLGGGTRSSGAYEFQADPVRYQGAALESLAGANSALAGKMAALR